MPQITRRSPVIALAVVAFCCLLWLNGCGDRNDQSSYDPQIGAHPGGWLPGGHAGAALAHIGNCRDCHGQDFSGGISKVACSQCHLGDQTHIHPLEWDIHGPLAYALHGGYVQQHGTGACANQFCHGASLQGVGRAPSCSSCHLGGPLSVHPVEWKNEITLHGGYVLQRGTAGCRNATCHGPQLQGAFLSGPACNDCHHFVQPIADIPVTAP